MEVNKNEVRRVKSHKANFIKVNIDIKEEPNVTFWLNILTMLPLPLVLIKAFSGLIADQVSKHTEYQITKQELLDILNACHGLDVQVETDDVVVDVQVY